MMVPQKWNPACGCTVFGPYCVSINGCLRPQREGFRLEVQIAYSSPTLGALAVASVASAALSLGRPFQVRVVSGLLPFPLLPLSPLGPAG